MHMGHASKRFPDFSVLGSTREQLTKAVTCVLVTHFHSDHCGAVPYLTETCGYAGPVIMSAPTACILPLVLEDFRKLAVDKRSEASFYSTQDIDRCVSKIVKVVCCAVLCNHIRLGCVRH